MHNIRPKFIEGMVMKSKKVGIGKPRGLARQLRTRSGKFAGSFSRPVKPVVKRTTVKQRDVTKVKSPATLGSLSKSARLTSGRLLALKATITRRFGAQPKRSNGVVSAVRSVLASRSGSKALGQQRGGKLKY